MPLLNFFVRVKEPLTSIPINKVFFGVFWLEAYSKIDISPLEYLAKNISIRILYAAPKVGHNWRNYVPTKRIKVWTVEPQVMYGWSDQLKINGQKGMYAWIRDNVDLRIKSRGI